MCCKGDSDNIAGKNKGKIYIQHKSLKVMQILLKELYLSTMINITQKKKMENKDVV